jgi:transcriptional regulator with XRE-family HTH domain
MSWRERLQGRIDNLGLTRAEVCRRAGVNATALRDIIDRGQTPSVENLSKLARAVGYTLTELYENGEPISLNFRITGISQGDGMWASLPPQQARIIPLNVFNEDHVWIEIGSDLEGTLYRRGDVIAGPKMSGTNHHNLIGSEVVMATKDGRQLIGILMPADKANRYSIRPFDPKRPDTRNVEVEWIAPVRFVIRGY